MLKSVWLGGIWSGSGDHHSSPSLLIACASELKVLTVTRLGKIPVGRILCFDWICCVEDKYEALFELHVYIAGWSSRRRCQLPMPTSGSQQRSAAIDAHSLSSVIVVVLVDWQCWIHFGKHVCTEVFIRRLSHFSMKAIAFIKKAWESHFYLSIGS